MKIVEIVPHVGAEASGPSYSVVELSRSLAAAGEHVELWSLLGGRRPSEGTFSHRVFPGGRALPSLGRSRAMLAALRSRVRELDVVHTHGLWMMPNVYPSWVVPRADKPLVISPRGTFSGRAMDRSRMKKRLFWAIAQGRAVRAASCFHATAEHEYHDIRRAGLRQPVCIIPNGVDVPPVSNDGRTLSKPGRRTLLYLGRLHPIKGVDVLLRAWAVVARERADWLLRIVGPPEDPRYVSNLHTLAARAPASAVEFIGPVYGPEKHAEYRRAELYVLPTWTENFGLTVAEALAAGTPVITTRGAPWSGLANEACGWWIEQGVDALVEVLLRATGEGADTLAEMGKRGRNWMLREYSWAIIGREMQLVYQWLTGRGPLPASVRVA